MNKTMQLHILFRRQGLQSECLFWQRAKRFEKEKVITGMNCKTAGVDLAKFIRKSTKELVISLFFLKYLSMICGMMMFR
jgi:hypothetical protein